MAINKAASGGKQATNGKASVDKAAVPVDSVKHKDKRVNIPTEELRDFVTDDESAPKSILYPRDPSLDPQLVWKGKDTQDQQDLEVPSVPIYIQEKINPQAIISEVRAQAKGDAPELASLFNDFDGIEGFDDMIEFYQHKANWANRMILGDSLLVMNSLAEKEGLKGQVQTLLLDPPFGIKFGSNWQASTRNRDVKDGKAEDISREPEVIKAFRDTWELGIHSYLSYMRDRLVVARELLTESGSVFVQIGDENAHLVRCLMDEVFGSENFSAEIHFYTTSGRASASLDAVTDRLLWYAKDIGAMKYRPLWRSRDPKTLTQQYTLVELADGSVRRATGDESAGLTSLPDGARRFMPGDMSSSGASEIGSQPFEYGGKKFDLPPNTHWKTSFEGRKRLAAAGRLEPVGQRLRYKRLAEDFPKAPFTQIWDDTVTSGFSSDKLYVVQTNPKVFERCVLMTSDPGDLVLDPTCGSGTTAYVAEQWGRRWITIDSSRVALALARTRLMAGKFPSYLLADTPEGAKKEAELTGIAPDEYPKGGDIKKGFIYKRVPRVTLKSIANNEEVDALDARWTAQMDPVRAKLNGAVGQQWEPLQVPREAVPSWNAAAKALHVEWWKLWIARKKEIDASIARRAETTLLYDQPYEDPKRLRVTGPFTVESLSPHRVLSAPVEQPESECEQVTDGQDGQFETRILENLKKAGVQNTVKGERLKFDRLDPFAGTCLNAAGEYTESGVTRRVAVCIGPEFGTVGPQLVKDAAKEAVQGLGFDLLIVCGFAFDPHVSEEAKRYGKLTVLSARMNSDLMMGEGVLKKTGAGNLFTVFGEPDIKIAVQGGKVVVDIKGVDIYDPTTGEIRSATPDQIACWFIDTDYNGESFFVRHAYFTGAGDPYEKLRKALRAEIDESAWAALNSTTSRPFDPPQSGKIAVKVINHFGDEVLKTYPIAKK